jgi:serine-type D-Ala-D-Ala carboxypeptidase (penicillin-binding protein 5/6)
VSRSVLTGGRRRRRRWPGVLARALALAALAAAAVVLTRGEEQPGGARAPVTRAGATGGEGVGGGGLVGAVGEDPSAPPPAATESSRTSRTVRSPLAVRLAEKPDPVRLRFRDQPRSGLLFDLDSGRVLWRRAPRRVLPIASLTKLMTALLVAERLPRGRRVLITRAALRYRGSGVGLLPRGKRIRVDTMLHGLLLPSGNDAAIALAQAAAGGSRRRFVRLMNRRARAMGLTCTRFSGPDGYEDRGNHSCAADLAVLARAVLRVRRLARIVRRRSAVLPFPIRGGRLYLYNNNPLLRLRYAGTTGLKTGYTDAAGRCLVATARRGKRKLAVVLLHSPDPGTQARRLLDRGWAAKR